MSGSTSLRKLTFVLFLAAAASAGAASCAAGGEGAGGSSATAASGAHVASSSSSSSSSSSVASSGGGAGGAATSSTGGSSTSSTTASVGGASSSSTSASAGGGGASASSTASSVASSVASSGAGGGAPAPTVIAIDPTNSLFSAPTSGVVITGADFVSGAAVKIAGVAVPPAACSYAGVPSTITCNVPAAAAPIRGDVVVTNPDLQVGNLMNGFTFTGTVNAVGFCNVQFPKDLTMASGKAVTAGTDVIIYGQIYEAGVTDANMNPAPGILADFGLSPLNPSGTDTNPTASTAWRFNAATPNPGYDFSKNNDEYQFDFAPVVTGSYRYAYRFSIDGGLNYTYCDADDANNGFDPTKVSQADVVP